MSDSETRRRARQGYELHLRPLTYSLAASHLASQHSISEAVTGCDEAVKEQLRHMLGPNLNVEQLAQAALPLRFGGLGFTMASKVRDAALVGGWASAAYLGHGVGAMCDELSDQCAHFWR